MNDRLIRIQSITKAFGGSGQLPALSELTAQIDAGRMTGLVGPDGAGKTTLLRLIAGLLLPSRGRISVLGFDTRSQAQKIHEFVAYMPQKFGLYEDLSVDENLRFYADLRSVTGAARRTSIARLLDFTGLAPFTKRRAGALSGGMKQKLGLACALVGQPRLLLLDEPSAGVDPVSRGELWRIVHELVDTGIGVVWSTTYLDEAERCPVVLLLSEGRLLHDGPPGELTQQVAQQTFAARTAGDERRSVLLRALKLPEVVDGVIQGKRVRLVMANGARPPTPADLMIGPDASIEAVAPRFEDAFMTLLGGGVKTGSPFEQAPLRRRVEDVPAVEADQLTRRFGVFTAAERITFSVRRGEIFGLIGPNGAGKSTTFRMLCGLLRPTSGQARVAGVDLVKAPARARSRLGYMAQKFSLYGDLSVHQNLRFFAGVYGLAGARRDAAIARMTETFALDGYLGADAGQLPLGVKQRLALACAVVHDPDVLFLDEPTSGVDPRTRREFWGHINAMVSHGVTVLVTTHFLDEAEYCDRVALIDRGRVITAGAPDDLKERVRSAANPDPTLEDAFIAIVGGDVGRSAA
jgi:ABC-2 type transport system ATP-binding protein